MELPSFPHKSCLLLDHYLIISCKTIVLIRPQLFRRCAFEQEIRFPAPQENCSAGNDDIAIPVNALVILEYKLVIEL